jgi:hypothetical protein
MVRSFSQSDAVEDLVHGLGPDPMETAEQFQIAPS